ncbi:hypothetical protein DOY81_010531, partial [Sarcophaga bullata]
KGRHINMSASVQTRLELFGTYCILKPGYGAVNVSNHKSSQHNISEKQLEMLICPTERPKNLIAPEQR